MVRRVIATLLLAASFAASADWGVYTSKDRMTDEVSLFAYTADKSDKYLLFIMEMDNNGESFILATLNPKSAGQRLRFLAESIGSKAKYLILRIDKNAPHKLRILGWSDEGNAAGVQLTRTILDEMAQGSTLL